MIFNNICLYLLRKIKQMTKERLDNLIFFAFTFKSTLTRDARSFNYNHSPDYIMENWNRYIGVMPSNESWIYKAEELSHYQKNIILEYNKKWKKDINYKILLFLNEIYENYLIPSELIEKFESITEIDINNIRNTNGCNLHTNMLIHIGQWKETKVVKRDYHLNLLV